MVKPQLTRIEKYTKLARTLQKKHYTKPGIMKFLDHRMMVEEGLSRTTRADTIKIIKAKVWPHS